MVKYAVVQPKSTPDDAENREKKGKRGLKRGWCGYGEQEQTNHGRSAAAEHDVFQELPVVFG